MNVSISHSSKSQFKSEALFNSGPPPFGMQIENRSYTSGDKGYRFAFNGKEKDDETFSNCIAFEARIFDARLGRFFSSDPWESLYSWQTPYAYFKNSPISIKDFKGKGGDPIIHKTKQGETLWDVAKTHYQENKQTIEGSWGDYWTKVLSWNKDGDYSRVGGNMYLSKRPIGPLMADGSYSVKKNTPNYASKTQTVSINSTTSSANINGGTIGNPNAPNRAPNPDGKPGPATDNGPGQPKAPSPPVSWSPLLTWTARCAGTLALVCTPMPAEDDCGGVDCQTIYRGVAPDHPGYSDAQLLTANPRGGNATPEEHNDGQTNSNYTSWTYSRGVADFWAHSTNGTPGTVLILKVSINDPRLIRSPDYHHELEVLIAGPVKANMKQLPLSKGTKTAY